MSDLSTPPPADGHGGLRLLAFVAASVALVLLAAGAFALSYGGVHAVALSGGETPQLARIYPLIFDAMLVVAGAAVLSLRGAGLPSLCYAWLALLVLLAAVATADALHATNVVLPRQPAAAVVAVIPSVLVLIGFGLLMTMLRYARLRRIALAAAERPAGLSGLAALGFAPAPPALPAGTADAGPVTLAETVSQAEPETEFEAPDGGPEDEAEPGSEAPQEPAAPLEFDRVRSSPVPPEA